MSVDIVSWMLNDLGIETDILMVPWARAIKDTRTKNWHVLFSVARTEERETWFNWVGPFYSDEILIYRKHAQHKPLPNMAEVKYRGRVLVSKDYPEESLLKEQGYKNLSYTTNPAISLKMLLADRADYLALGKAALPCLMSKEGVDPQALEPTDISIHATKLYIALSLSTPLSEVMRWQKSLDKLKANPLYHQMINNSRHCQ